MNYLENFFELDFISIIIAIATILLTWQFLDKLLIWVCEKTGIEFRHIRKRREEHDLLIKTAENLSKLQEQYREDMKRAAQNNEAIKQEFTEFVSVISRKLDDMKTETDMRFYANEEKQNKKEQAKIKAEISSRYSIYHERKWITDIEFEALEGLISTYESFGGLNSFVHSVVQKEMFTWKKVNTDQN